MYLSAYMVDRDEELPNYEHESSVFQKKLRSEENIKISNF
jgi:hypothetical protein